MNRKKINANILIILLAFFVGYSFSGQKSEKDNDEYIEKTIKIERIYKVGEDNENEDFYGPRSFAVGSDERLYVLDTKNSRVQCFSNEGKFLLSFGRFGQGPGELSQYASKIKILEDNNIYIIDISRSIKIYDLDGNFKRSLKVDGEYNDIEMIDGKYYLSSCYMEQGRKAIHVFDISGKKLDSFGIIIEPEEGIISKIEKESMKGVLDSFFNSSQFSRIVRTSNKELIYSLYLPYRFIMYDVEGRIIHDISGNIDYGKKEKFSIVYKKNNYPLIMPNPPLPSIFAATTKDDGTILVPFLKMEQDFLYIDSFDDGFNFIQRYKIQDRIANEGNHIYQAYIDKKNNLYCLVRPLESDDLPYIVRYKLLI